LPNDAPQKNRRHKKLTTEDTEGTENIPARFEFIEMNLSFMKFPVGLLQYIFTSHENDAAMAG